MITATGRTFEHRDTLMQMGGWFNRAEKRWQFDHLTASQMTRLRGLVGVMVFDNGNEPARPEPTDDEVAEVIARVLEGASLPSSPRPRNNQRSVIYGDDPTYHNHFADQNASAFFGFSSLDAFTTYLTDLPSHVRRDERRMGWEDGAAEFYGTRRMSDALALAHEGWQDGLEAASAIVERLTLANPRVRARKPSLAGGSVSVGRMLAGDPAHMIRRPKSPGRKVVTIFVEAGMPGAIDATVALNRAAIIGAIVDLMENSGYSCTVVVVDTSVMNRKPVYQLAVTIKTSGERLSLADAIFAFGHPAFSRRFSFAAQTSVDETRHSWSAIGNPSNAFDDHHPCGPSEFYVPVLTNRGTSDPLSLLRHIVPKNLPIKIERD